MTQSADMRRESGTCNVCAAPCSSCMHINRALMESKTGEFTDENCRLMEANQSSMDEGDASSVRSRACESLQHAVSEASNMLSVNSSHDSLSENADSRQALSNNYQGSKCLEVLDDYTSCLSRASEANLANSCHYRNADRINLSCRSTSVSCLGADVSGSAPSVDVPSFSEIPSYKDVDTDLSSPKIQSPCTQSLLSIPSIMDLKKDSSSHIPKKLSECSLEFIDQSSTKEAAPTAVFGEKSLPDKNSLIDCTAKVSENIHQNLETSTDNDVGGATEETVKCSVSGKQDERSDELVESPEVDMQEHQSEDESDKSDIVEHDVKVCDICGDAGREDLLAICSRCSDGAEHTYCMREMLRKVPEGNWLCEECKYVEATENQRLEETENQRLGKSEVTLEIEKGGEERKLNKLGYTSQISAKRHSENIGITPAAKRQAVESSTGSPKPSSPKRLVSLSRESSFKSPDKGKVKPSNQLSFCHSSSEDMEVVHSPTNGPQGQMPKGTLLKSNSFSTLNSKPRVKLVDEVVTQKQKGAGEHASKSMETPARMISRSMSFKSTNLGRSSAIESKVKMLSSKSSHVLDMKGSNHAKEWGAVDRKKLSRVDRPAVCSTMSSSVVSTPKGDQKLTPHGETSKPLSGNSRELKVNHDGKSSSFSKTTSSLGRKGVEAPNSSDRTSIILGGTLQDVQPRSRETTNQAEKNREGSSDCTRLGISTASKSIFCPKCRGSGHSTECCTVGSIAEASIELSTTRSSKEEVHKGNRSKAAINAALLRRPEICKKKEVPNQIGGFSTSGTDLNCEAISQDQALTPKNSVAAEITHDGQENLESSISETSKCSSINDLKQLNACQIDSCPHPENSDPVGPAGKPPVRDLYNEALAISNVLSTTVAIPEYDYVWQGIFEVHKGGKPPDLFSGIQAHLSACSSPKVLEVVKNFSPNVILNEVPRLSTWPSQFNQGGAKEDNVALYFFAKDVESYERHYKGLLDHMIRNDSALKAIFDGVELLVFPSNQLPEKSQRWNMLFFLWGVFMGRRMKNSDSTEKICIPSLNVIPVENDFPTAVMTLSETCCSPKRMDEDSINCDRTSSAVLTSTPIDKSHVTLTRNSDIKETNLEQTHLGSQVNLEQQDSRFNIKSPLTLPTSSAQLCQEMKSTGSSLNGCLLEDGPDRESKISFEAIGTSKVVETKTDCDISIEQENSLSGNKELGAAKIITEDKMSERMNSDKDQERLKRKQKEDYRFIDIEAAIEEDLTLEGVNCRQPTDINLRDPSDSVFQSSGVTFQRMPWSEVNGKSEDGESSTKKLKTGLCGIYGGSSSGGRDVINGSFASFANGLGSCSPVEDKGCEDACDEKIIREDLGTMERTFFPVNARNKNDLQLGEDSCPKKGPHEHEDQFHDGIPNLELALGGDAKRTQKGMLPFFVGVVDKKNMQGKPRDGLRDELDDGVAASLSLSLSFPSSDKECVKPVSKAEQRLPDGNHVNTSLLLFGSFSDK
ncbi:hypothetical protein L6164_021730 [Bauhinia variegata]|uniref:Uncharacterized protein n=1 Tax=Bauhinia variegata TaxID=167791 RepID=A0ACB9MCD9_BAUVA|nr:hypothetical protein L6164_021730 [Bauhinia variegata]